MNLPKVYTVIGLMSGTSLDGIDAALLRTDGQSYVQHLGFLSQPYDEALRMTLRACLGRKNDPDGAVALAADQMTRAHAQLIQTLLDQTGFSASQIDLIGFHGQTLFHDPENRFTWQIGNGALLADLTGISVVNDFRSADVAAGGQGAPLIPLYHRALVAQAGLQLPVAILNLGGVGNITYLTAQDEDMLGFDTGPANALIDDWIKQHTGDSYDAEGAIARSGQINDAQLKKWLSDPYFATQPPKSLDRDAWSTRDLQGYSVADGAATLTAFTVQSVVRAFDYLPQRPKNLYVTGGGRHNSFIMECLGKELGIAVASVDELSWNGDAIEAEGFGYLAVRSLLGLPLSVPGTTGVPEPLSGGVLHRAENQAQKAREN
jgi:anhydro-N-acetylmuramic acid kinase